MLLSSTMALAAGCCIVLGQRINSGRVQHNRFPGVRTAATIANEAAWAAGQRASLPYLRAWAWLFAGGSAAPLVVAVVSADVDASVTLALVVDLVVLLFAHALAVPMVLASNRAARVATASDTRSARKDAVG